MTTKKNDAISSLFILIIASLFAVMGVRELIEFQSSKNHKVYPSDTIALTYREVRDFVKFLNDNVGTQVIIDAQLRFDVATSENMLISDACGYEEILDKLQDDPRKFNDLRMGLANISGEEGELTQNHIACNESFSFTNLPVYQLSFIYGGTGTVSLPINGLFDINVIRSPSGNNHYTLTRVPDGVL